jgi:integrase
MAGYLFKRKKNGKELSVWWCKYYQSGRPRRESTGTTKKTVAQRVLDDRVGRAARGEPVLARADKIRWEEAEADLKQHYEAHGSRNLSEYSYRVAHLTGFFRGRKLATIGPQDVTAYIVKRQAEQAANGTIRRELGTLTKMLRIAYENGKLLRLPVVRKPKEGAPREGFFEPDAYDAVRRRLAPDLQAAVAISYVYGWRMQSEVLTLERRQLDLEAGTLRLDPGSTKNDDGRVVYLTTEVKALLVAQLERIRAVERKAGRVIPFLFPYLSGPKRLGERRRDFRKAWATACKAAGVPGRYRHDFRRTAVRNMEQAGVPRSVAMKLTGHKTENIYRRYAIVSDADLADAARRLSGHTSGHTTAGHANLGTVTS